MSSKRRRFLEGPKAKVALEALRGERSFQSLERQLAQFVASFNVQRYQEDLGQSDLVFFDISRVRFHFRYRLFDLADKADFGHGGFRFENKA